MEQALTMNEHQVGITTEALKEMETILDKEEYRGKAVRLVIAGMGCSGPQLGLALDDPNADDVVLEGSNFQMLADQFMKDQIKASGGLTIEYIDDPYRGSGILIQFVNSAGGCGGGCSSGGCGTGEDTSGGGCGCGC
jgi:Fe-S cluster assembly iron-binding protein IscA